MLYLLTISAQQKKAYISAEQIMEVISFLTDQGVLLTSNNAFETSGKYRQLHWHGIVQYKGLWKHLISFGDLTVNHNTFQITWKRIRTNIQKVIKYINKDIKADGITPDARLTINYLRHHYHSYD